MNAEATNIKGGKYDDAIAMATGTSLKVALDKVDAWMSAMQLLLPRLSRAVLQKCIVATDSLANEEEQCTPKWQSGEGQGQSGGAAQEVGASSCQGCPKDPEANMKH